MGHRQRDNHQGDNHQGDHRQRENDQSGNPHVLPTGAFSPALTIAGVDEVGRGPWAGPVVAAALILRGGRPDPLLAPLIRDSKTLTAKQRNAAFNALVDHRASFAVGAASTDEIDRINILQASLLAMRRALIKLDVLPDMILVDGIHAPPHLPTPIAAVPVHTVIRGDHHHPAIAGASIIAKVIRDRIMTKLCTRHRGFSWHSNAGYGTRDHRAALAKHGITPHHRRSFKPIAALIGKKRAIPR